MSPYSVLAVISSNLEATMLCAIDIYICCYLSFDPFYYFQVIKPLRARYYSPIPKLNFSEL